MSIGAIFLLPNGTFFVELIVLLVILFLTTKYIVPPLRAAMDKRQELIRSSLEAAESARTDAAAADDERRQVLDEARVQAREIVAQANAIDDAADQLGTIVMGVVERVIGREVDMSAHQDLVNEAVGALRSSAAAGETGAQG